MERKQLASTVMAAYMLTCAVQPAMAATNKVVDGKADSKVTLQVLADGGNGDGGSDIMNITVPAELPIVMDLAGNVVVSNNAKIINNSKEKTVKVVGIEAKAGNSWEIKEFDTDMAKLPDDTKALAMEFRGDKLGTDGNFSLTDGNWVIDKGAYIDLNMGAKVPKQTKSGKEKAAVIQFTVDWNTDGGKEIIDAEELTDATKIDVTDTYDNTPVLVGNSREVALSATSIIEAVEVKKSDTQGEIGTITDCIEVLDLSLDGKDATFKLNAKAVGTGVVEIKLDNGYTKQLEVNTFDIEKDNDTGVVNVDIGDIMTTDKIVVGADLSNIEHGLKANIKTTGTDDIESNIVFNKGNILELGKKGYTGLCEIDGKDVEVVVKLNLVESVSTGDEDTGDANNADGTEAGVGNDNGDNDSIVNDTVSQDSIDSAGSTDITDTVETDKILSVVVDMSTGKII